MSKGYLLFAQDTDQVCYSRLATACALSIKITQPAEYAKVSVVTNNPAYFDPDLFDQIIPSNTLVGMDARSRAYDLSPYEQTVLLDSDMLFLKPVDHYWPILETLDLFVASNPQTYQQKPIVGRYYRTIFDTYKLPDVYSAWTYFKKSVTAAEFFEQVKLMTDNPTEFINVLMPESYLTTLPTDEAFALALAILELEDHAVFPEWGFPQITHMKSMVQGWSNPPSDWNDRLRFTLDNQGQVKLGVCSQTDILHYVKKDIITDDMIRTLRAAI